MLTEPATERLTYDDWRKLPETMRCYEVIDGVIRMPPAPTSDHQWTVFAFGRKLAGHVEARSLGVVLVAPVDVVIQKEPLRTRQPDILFLSTERTGVRGRKELQQMPVIEIAPDLVVEVLSPSDARSAMNDKIEDYRRIGVRECWIASPEAGTVEVMRLTTETAERLGLYGPGDTVRSGVLPELALPVDELFA
jgi:Uma2 family endonuclease